MFLESLLEPSAPAKNRRGWATLTSFLIEAAAIGLLILAPMLYTDALPVLHQVGAVFTVPPAEPAPESKADTGQRKPTEPPPTELDNGVMHVPPSFPDHPYQPKGPEPAAPTGGTDGVCIPCVPGSTGDSGPLNPTIGKYLEGGGAPRPKPPVDSRPVAVISQIVEGMLIYRVQPVYPQTAIITRVQGSVTLRAIIGRDGTIQHLRAESGPPMLVPAALDAVRQWRYRPFYLNGQAVEVETQVTVNFVLTK